MSFELALGGACGPGGGAATEGGDAPHLTPMPPSEWTTVPVIPRARSEASNT